MLIEGIMTGGTTCGPKEGGNGLKEGESNLWQDLLYVTPLADNGSSVFSRRQPSQRERSRALEPDGQRRAQICYLKISMLSLSFLVCEVGIMISTWQACCKD